MARDLAPLWEVDAAKACKAGWLHDYARSLGGPQLLALARKHGIPVDDIERQVPVLLHGRVGAAMIKADRLCHDPEVLAAVRDHVTGDAGMNSLGRLLFVADMVEPGRDYPGVENLRRLAADDPGEALRACIKSRLAYLLENGFLIHPRIIFAYNAFGRLEERG